MNELRPPIKPGEWALDFALSRADQEGTVSVADYRGRSPLLLSFFRGLYCAFCRRAIWRRHLTNNKLRALDVETLGVVATTPENARRYFRYRPAHSALAADPDLTALRAYGFPKVELPPGGRSSPRGSIRRTNCQSHCRSGKRPGLDPAGRLQAD